MDQTTTSNRLGDVISKRLSEAGITTERQVEDATGIAKTTWRRRLRFGDWKVAELEAIGVLLGSSVSDLLAEAEAAA